MAEPFRSGWVSDHLSQFGERISKARPRRHVGPEVLERSVHRMRLHLPRKRGQVVNPFFGTNHRKEAATVTPADIIYSRRCHVIERAAIVGVARASLGGHGGPRQRRRGWPLQHVTAD